MAIKNVPPPVGAGTGNGLSAADQARLNYQVLREQMNRAAAVANALGLHQTPDSHAYHLAQQLDDMLGRSDYWYKLDAYFGVDHNGETVEVNHG